MGLVCDIIIKPHVPGFLSCLSADAVSVRPVYSEFY